MPGSHPSYDRLALKEVKVYEIITWKWVEILKAVKRRIIFKQKFKDPWIIKITESIHRSVFIPCFQAIRDHVVHFDFSFNVKRNRQGHGEFYTLVFKHFGELHFHLSKLSGQTKGEVLKCLKKDGSHKRKASVVVSPERPATITYNVKKARMTVELSYDITNRYGNVCSH